MHVFFSFLFFFIHVFWRFLAVNDEKNRSGEVKGARTRGRGVNVACTDGGLAEIQVTQLDEPSERRGHLGQRVVVRGQLSQRSQVTDRRRHRSQPVAVQFQTGQRREFPEHGRGYRREQIPRCSGAT